MTIGTLVAFTALQSGIFRPLMGLLDVGASIVSSMALFSRIFGYLDLPVEVAAPDAPRRRRPGRGARRGAVRGRRPTATPTRDRDALADVDLVVPAGTTLALVGETGSGKTTLAGLVSAAARPDRRAGDRSTASTCATCPSTTSPASSAWSPRRPTCCTPRSATTCCSPGPTRRDAELWRALEAAQIADLVATLPDGLDTVVGARGLPVLRRREAAARHRPDAAARPPGARPRRGHQRPRQRDRA